MNCLFDSADFDLFSLAHLLNDYSKHSGPYYSGDNKCHINSCCVRSHLLRPVVVVVLNKAWASDGTKTFGVSVLILACGLLCFFFFLQKATDC